MIRIATILGLSLCLLSGTITAQPGQGQPNSPQADFRVNGNTGGPYPMTFSIRSFAYLGRSMPSLAFQTRGAPLARYTTFVSTLAANTIPTPAGRVDLDVASGFRILGNGLEGEPYFLDFSGFREQLFALAAPEPNLAFGAIQVAVADPSSPLGFTLSAATDLNIIGAPGTSWFVSQSIGSNANPGTATAPFRNLANALAVAVAGDAIFVEAGTYDETGSSITFIESVPIIGGCQVGSWFSEGQRSRILLPAEGFSAHDIDLPTRIENFHFLAADGTAPSEASTAARILDCSDLKFRNCLFESGKGSDGLNGRNGRNGSPGCPGGGASGRQMRGRGARGYVGAISLDCTPAPDNSRLADGGLGGSGGRHGNGGSSGESKSSTVRGGSGGRSGDCITSVSSGGDGDHGHAGSHASSGGVATLTRGAFVESGTRIVWSSATTGDGAPGADGMGGAGGGQGGGEDCVFTGGFTGEYGGGGGGGGNGGEGGLGGGEGGPSVAVVLFDSSIVFIDCAFRSGDGGNGGHGGAGGLGGAGGPGESGSRSRTGRGSGGDGGSGGRGGDASGGAGGNGGMSYCIYRRTSGIWVGFSSITYDPGTHGLGGAAGGTYGRGAAGESGVAGTAGEQLAIGP